LFVFDAFGEPDEHAFNQIIKKTISANPPSALFSQPRDSFAANIYSSSYSFSSNPALTRILFPSRSRI